MRNRALTLALALVLASLSSSLSAVDRQGFDLSVLVDGNESPEYASRGKVYIEARKGRNFSLRVHNPTCQRIAVALSVDGLNVVDAKRTTASEATKWILAPGQSIEIPGWQMSSRIARRFFFTETKKSYAKWIGDTRNVGTIEAVFFREKASPLPARCGPGAPIAESPVDQPETYPPPASASGADATTSSEEGAPTVGSAAAVPQEVEVRGEAPAFDDRRSRRDAPAKSAGDFAATGAGSRTDNPVVWVDFEEDPNPVARVALRYEFRTELVRLGVFPREDDLYAREGGRGFERYAPDPRPNR
ncbi:MAG: hypothetical protein ABI610_09235 [Acidobacteriota bacterium]